MQQSKGDMKLIDGDMSYKVDGTDYNLSEVTRTAMTGDSRVAPVAERVKKIEEGTKSLSKLVVNAELIGDTETHKVQIGRDVKLVDGDISFVDEASAPLTLRGVAKRAFSVDSSIATLQAESTALKTGKGNLAALGIGKVCDTDKYSMEIKGPLKIHDKSLGLPAKIIIGNKEITAATAAVVTTLRN